jgi:hypothetical protein
MWNQAQSSRSRGIFVQLCLQGDDHHFDVTLHFTPIKGSGFQPTVKRYVRSSYMDDFYGTQCHNMLFRGFEQVKITFGALEYEVHDESV